MIFYVYTRRYRDYVAKPVSKPLEHDAYACHYNVKLELFFQAMLPKGFGTH